MSGGDKDDPIPFTPPQTRAILRLPVVLRRMKRPVTINATDYDIPYLAGYSKGGDTIYIDRDLEPFVHDGRTISTDQFLKLHEHVEKSVIDALLDSDEFDRRVLLDCLGMKSPRDRVYFHAHGVATCVELFAVQGALGAVGLAAYNQFMKTQVKRAEDERIRRVPADLDMTPYAGDDVMDRRLRAAMKRAMAA